jgi:hypothetical protein
LVSCLEKRLFLLLLSSSDDLLANHPLLAHLVGHPEFLEKWASISPREEAEVPPSWGKADTRELADDQTIID